MRTLTVVLFAVLVLAALPGAAQADRLVVVLEADGPVAPVMQGYIRRGIEYAEEHAAEALIIRLNTPGGSVSTTEEIVQLIRSTRTPVVVYVAPPGAMAASAGTLITLAGHAAAMAPDTIIGAASPINLDGSDLPDETAEEKAQQVLAATARSLAERRGETAQELAVATITEARAVHAGEALEAGLIDLVSPDLDALLEALEGFTVEVFGQEVTLHTAGLPAETLALTPLEEALQVLTDPTLVFTLLSLGTLLIIIEFNAPGGWAAGSLGFVAVVLAFYGLGVLPVNWLGLAFVVLAVILFVLETQAPTHGVLSLSAGASLVAGGVILFSRPELAPFGALSLPVVVAQAAILVAVFIFFITRGVMSVKGPSVTGAEGLVGQVVEVRVPLTPEGTVFIEGERWRATSTRGHVEAGGWVRVVSVDRLHLTVEPVDEA